MRTKSKLVHEPPPANYAEVKRRFIRQNRDLAKNNSAQSLRIRSLELEVSRIRADNLDLRNRVLQLQNEVHTARREAGAEAVKTVKAELRGKIRELSCLVDGVEGAPEEDKDRGRGRRGSVEPGNWRERQPLAELMRDSQMPTIDEEKLYPRETLGVEEVQVVRLSGHSSNESPDLGPPPVARFEEEEENPVKHASPLGRKIKSPHAATTEEEGEEEEEEEDHELPAALSANLETRRKRKDGQPKLEIRRHSVLPQSPAKGDGESTSILRTGAKRKLSDRETEKPIKPPSKGDFSFRSKATQEEVRHASAEPTKAAKAASTAQSERQAPSSPKPTRRVLGEKSVNMSPRKEPAKPDKAGKEESSEKPPTSRPTTGTKERASSTRRRRISSIPLPTPGDDVAVLETVELPPPAPAPSAPATSADPPPLTPAPDDLFSPTPSEPSTHPSGPDDRRGDTPPPSDLSTLSNTTTTTCSAGGGTLRPSRRARSAVNYAEPSLISKMRRPGREMVDAVTVIGAKDASRRASSGSAVKEVVIKKEEEEEEGGDDGSWKDLPPADLASSPLSQNRGSSEGGAMAFFPTERRGVGNDTLSPAPAPGIDGEGRRPSASSATMSALMAGSRKRRQSSLELPLGTDIATFTSTDTHTSTNGGGNGDVDATARKLEELDLYEFKGSSSPSPPLTDNCGGHRGDPAPSRRSGSGTTTGGKGGFRSAPSAAAAAAAESKRSQQRRHSSIPKDLVASDVSAVGSRDAERGGRGVGGSRPVPLAAAVTGRSERAAGRRRSMML